MAAREAKPKSQYFCRAKTTQWVTAMAALRKYPSFPRGVAWRKAVGFVLSAQSANRLRASFAAWSP
jgi:hypothetical protein